MSGSVASDILVRAGRADIAGAQERRHRRLLGLGRRLAALLHDAVVAALRRGLRAVRKRHRGAAHGVGQPPELGHVALVARGHHAFSDTLHCRRVGSPGRHSTHLGLPPLPLGLGAALERRLLPVVLGARLVVVLLE